MSLWPMGHGELTMKGKMRSLELGRWLRSRYDNFLPEIHNSSEFHLRSTDVDRSLMSASAVLAGMYPPVGPQIWNKGIGWQPIPVHTVPIEQDRVLYIGRHGFGRACRKYAKLYDASIHSDFFKSINEQYANFYKEVSKLTGWNITDVNYFAQLQSVLTSYASYNASYLPRWAKTIDFDKVTYLAGLNYARYTFTRDLKRLSAGPYIYYIIKHFEKFVKGDADMPKFLMLMSHESTVAGILNAMELFDYRVPDFSATVIWELRKNRRTHFVNIIYKRTFKNDAVEKLKLKNCGFDCNFEDFKNIFNPISVNSTEWAKECDDV